MELMDFLLANLSSLLLIPWQLLVSATSQGKQNSAEFLCLYLENPRKKYTLGVPRSCNTGLIIVLVNGTNLEKNVWYHVVAVEKTLLVNL